LKIRTEQFEALDEAARSDFHRRLAAFLRGEMPEQTAEFDDAALLALIEECEREAAKLGIVTEGGVSQFTCLGFMAGADFAERPAIREYLAGPGDDPEARLGELVEYLAALEEEQGA
jgi:hypothetical protein